MVWGVPFSPDGAPASTGGEDEVFRLCDLDGGQEIRRFGGHTSAVRFVALTPDGRRALPCSDDHAVRCGM